MDFLIGGLATTLAGFFSNPFDVIKTRQQLQGELQRRTGVLQPYSGIWRSAKSIVRADGYWGLQKGLSPALMFQFVMNSIRLGLYQTVDSQLLWTRFGANKNRSTALCVFWGGMAGMIGSVVSCPMYLIKVQIQAQSLGEYAVGYQHKHKGMLDALRTIFLRRGLSGLWQGCTAQIPRAIAGSAAQLSTFTYSKDVCLRHEIFRESIFLTACVASVISGFCCAFCMTPFDVVATRILNQGTDQRGRNLLYNGIFDCFFKTLKIEGLHGIYKGFFPNFCRIGPHTILSLTFWEELKMYHAIHFPRDKK